MGEYVGIVSSSSSSSKEEEKGLLLKGTYLEKMSMFTK